MLKINIPGRKELTLSHLILDYNGTIAEDDPLFGKMHTRIPAYHQNDHCLSNTDQKL